MIPTVVRRLGVLLSVGFLLLACSPADIFADGQVEWIDGVRVVNLWGAPYEMGRQHGELLRDEVRGSVQQALGYCRRYLKIPFIGAWAADWWLGSAWRTLQPFVPQDRLEELRGLADGSGVSLADLYRLHALPERTYACSNFAVWGPATIDGRLIHVRNLDWNFTLGIQRYATVFVMHPIGHAAFVSVGWAGFIGVLTGINEHEVSIGQVGAQTQAASFRGEPFPFVMRRVLEQAHDVDDAATMIRTATRTTGINYVIGDAATRQAIAIETNRVYACVFKDDDPLEHAVSYARPIPSAVFRADTAINPQIRAQQLASNGNPRRPGLEPPSGSAYEIRYLGQAAGIMAFYGQIDAEKAQYIAKTVAPESNIQSVIFSWPDAWIANASSTTRASQTAYHHLQLQQLLADPPVN